MGITPGDSSTALSSPSFLTSRRNDASITREPLLRCERHECNARGNPGVRGRNVFPAVQTVVRERRQGCAYFPVRALSWERAAVTVDGLTGPQMGPHDPPRDAEMALSPRDRERVWFLGFVSADLGRSGLSAAS
jgi:hypothetical protein